MDRENMGYGQYIRQRGQGIWTLDRETERGREKRIWKLDREDKGYGQRDRYRQRRQEIWIER